MKTISLLPGLFALSLLSGCKPPDNTAAEEARRQLEQTQAEYARQAAEMQQRSADLQKQLADVQKAMQDKENAELKARLEAIQQENAKLMADAEAARQKSEALRQEIAKTPAPAARPYVPPMPEPVSPQPWADPEADYSLFYDSLNPHGRWLEVDGYGYAFRPNYAERSSWRPYVDGRWVSTDQGWAWDTNEPFGWACYHYGRWIKATRHGWLWIPGREWAPAWVSWRHSSDRIGWAPLPPSARNGFIGHDCDERYGLSPASYVFIEASNFGRSSYVNVSLSFSSVTSFFQQTINVTNIVHVQQNNTCIQRGGPALDWVEKRIGARVVKAPVQLVRTLERPIEFRRDRSQPSFIAAPLPSGRHDRKPVIPRTAERVQKPVMIDGWKDVPADKRDGLRQAILQQSRKPQPKPVLADSPRAPEPLAEQPRQTVVPVGVTPEVRPAIPQPGIDRGRGERPTMPKLEITQDAANKAELARRAAEVRMQEAQADRERQMAEQKAAMAAQQQELAQKQAEAAALKQRMAEQAREAALLREQQASEMSAKEAAALKQKQEAEMAAQQQELTRKQAEALAMQQEMAEQAKKAQAAREEQAALMQQREAEAQQAKEAAMAAQQAQIEAEKQREMQTALQMGEERRQAQVEAIQAREAAMAQQQAAKEELARREQEFMQQRTQQEAMKAQLEAAEQQRTALMERQQQEAAMRAEQEATARAKQEAMRQQLEQQAAMKAAQEAAERQREAAMQAQQEAAERQRQIEMQRQQQEAAMRAAAQEAAERQREAAMQAQREAAERAQQEAMRRAAEEAAERQREAMRQQQEEARRQAEEAARQREQNQPAPGQ